MVNFVIMCLLRHKYNRIGLVYHTLFGFLFSLSAIFSDMSVCRMLLVIIRKLQYNFHKTRHFFDVVKGL